jgi:FlaG/FlaF family flagellin (archaellin)
VALPPGRLRLATRPIATGSPPMAKTIGMVAVAALAASVASVLTGVAMTAHAPVDQVGG